MEHTENFEAWYAKYFTTIPVEIDGYIYKLYELSTGLSPLKQKA